MITASYPARTLFLVSAAVTLALGWWTHELSLAGPGLALSASFFYFFTVLDQPAAWGLLLVLVGAALVARPSWSSPVARWVSEHVRAIAAATAVALSLGTLFVYRDHPLSMDEYAVRFQSQVFAAGHLAGRFPGALLDRLLPEDFQNSFLYVSHQSGALASGYWPSFALLLTPFTWLGIPWACNAIISALTILAVHRLALRLFDSGEAAGFAVLLTIASPVFFADGISYYSMSAHLLANTVYALLLLRPTPARALGAGLIGSIALTLHNPVPHLLFAVPWFMWMARQPNAPRLLLCLCAGYLPLCLILGFGWPQFIHALPNDGVDVTHGINAVADNVNAAMGAAFSLPTIDVLYARLIGVAKIWLWSVPGLLLLAGVGAWKLRHNAGCRLLVTSAVVTLLGYLLIPFDQGHGWGFRYFHSAWMVLPLLAAGVLALSPSENLRAFVTVCALLTLVLGVGQRAMQIRQFVSTDLAQLPHYSTERRHVEFVGTTGFYTLDLVQNDPWLRGNEIRMVSHGLAADTELMQRYFPEMQRVYDDTHGSVWARLARNSGR